MNVNDLFAKKYLAKEDVKQPTVTTVVSVTQVEMNDKGGKVMKPVIFFAAFSKPMVLNKLNAQILASFLGSDTDAWTGKSVEVYVDPTVMMEGRMVGGVRVRATSQSALVPIPGGIDFAKLAAVPGHTFTQSAQLWDYSDGQNAKGKQTTEQVLAFLADLLSNGVPLTAVKVQPAGNPGGRVPAAGWYSEHASAGVAPIGDDTIPW